MEDGFWVMLIVEFDKVIELGGWLLEKQRA
jgi:hypothetical protein